MEAKLSCANSVGPVSESSDGSDLKRCWVTHLRVSPTLLNPNMLEKKKSMERSQSSLILSSLALHLELAPSLTEHVKFKCGADEVDQGGLLE